MNLVTTAGLVVSWHPWNFKSLSPDLDPNEGASHGPSFDTQNLFRQMIRSVFRAPGQRDLGSNPQATHVTTTITTTIHYPCVETKVPSETGTLPSVKSSNNIS